jgi:hypothetical protein
MSFINLIHTEVFKKRKISPLISNPRYLTSVTRHLPPLLYHSPQVRDVTAAYSLAVPMRRTFRGLPGPTCTCTCITVQVPTARVVGWYKVLSPYEAAIKNAGRRCQAQ